MERVPTVWSSELIRNAFNLEQPSPVLFLYFRPGRARMETDEIQNVFSLSCGLGLCFVKATSRLRKHVFFFSLSRLQFSDIKVYEPSIRARLGTAAYLCEVVAVKLIVPLRYHKMVL